MLAQKILNPKESISNLNWRFEGARNLRFFQIQHSHDNNNTTTRATKLQLLLRNYLTSAAKVAAGKLMLKLSNQSLHLQFFLLLFCLSPHCLLWKKFSNTFFSLTRLESHCYLPVICCYIFKCVSTCELKSEFDTQNWKKKKKLEQVQKISHLLRNRRPFFLMDSLSAPVAFLWCKCIKNYLSFFLSLQN